MKHLALIALAAASALTFSACDKNDEQKKPVETAAGFYVLNQGNASSGVPSTLTAFDYESGMGSGSNSCAFQNANNFQLGSNATDAMQYGSKLYIASYSSDVIWVADPVTLKVISQIQPGNELAGHNPRHFTAHKGKVYASMYTGYVAEIDTTLCAITREIKVGPNPEGLAVSRGKLYVGNSDGMNWTAGYTDNSISIIDLDKWTETQWQDHSKFFNVTKLISRGDDLFALSMGDYGAIKSSVKRIRDREVTDICEATTMAVSGNTLYTVNCVYGDVANSKFRAFDITSLQEVSNPFINQTSSADAKIDYTTAVGVDPITGDIVITSNYVDPATGWGLYSDPGYANIYDRNGNFKQRISTGVGPVEIVFVHSYK
ncbi:MAG: hypothetical protein K2M87_03685 [Muribaculaceae bacterium]|nr:hypothetical protein [Muribaculaceae bacterium]